MTSKQCVCGNPKSPGTHGPTICDTSPVTTAYLAECALTSKQQLLQRVLVALNLAMSGFRAHEGRYGDGETTVASKRAQAVINDLIPVVEAAASLPVETTPRHLQPSYVLEQIMNNSTDPWAQGVARSCLMGSPEEPT
jgi:hypothetical protein